MRHLICAQLWVSGATHWLLLPAREQPYMRACCRASCRCTSALLCRNWQCVGMHLRAGIGSLQSNGIGILAANTVCAGSSLECMGALETRAWQPGLANLMERNEGPCSQVWRSYWIVLLCVGACTCNCTRICTRKHT